MNTSLTQRFVVCALDESGNFVTKEAKPCAVACALFELASDGFVKVARNNDKVRCEAQLPVSQRDLLPVYDYVEQHRVVDADELMEHMLSEDFSAFMASICDPLREQGLLVTDKSETTFVPDADARKQIVDHIVAALDGDEPMKRDDAALLAFLDGAGLADHVFGREERRNIKELLRDQKWDSFKFATTPAGKDTFVSAWNDVEEVYAPIVSEYVAKH
ncbi:GPP34 family phosphoprotein [Atopobiaceae bacterium 24-176]